MTKHHGSHRHLLAKPERHTNPVDALDAIIVPTNRTPAYLHRAIDLAARLDCVLLVLCSQRASVAGTVDRGRQLGVEVVAIDVDRLPKGFLPAFETTALLAGKPFERRTDTSLKRNIGLLFAKAAGWQRVVFLDDDIEVPDPQDLTAAAELADSFAGVGLAVGGYPDNSVVCHAYREVGNFQDTFVGGGALAVGTSSLTSFFPKVYNEDWFFLLDDQELRPTAVTGRAVQKPYDPFANETRARTEEFGDCLAEGVFALFDNGGRIEDADTEYWRRFLDSRLELINGVLAKIEVLDRDPAEKRRMVAALKAARGRCMIIKPELCVEYLEALRNDRKVWRDYVNSVHEHLGPADALVALGLASYARHTLRRREPALV